jgi:hypothetical protein
MFLAGESDLSDQGERDARYRIRNRLKDGLFDMVFLNAQLHSNDREQVANDVFTKEPHGLGWFTGINSLLFRMLLDVSEDEDSWIRDIETVVSAAITRGLNSIHEEAIVDVEVNVDPDVRQPDIDELLDKYADMEETREELDYLRENDAIEVDETYWTHIFHHYWVEQEEVNWLLPNDEIISVDPTSYNSKEDFITDCEEKRRKAVDQWREQEE